MTHKFAKYRKIIHALPDEEILYVAKKHRMFYIFELFIPLFFVIIAVVLMVAIKYTVMIYIGIAIILFSLLAFYKIRVDYYYDIIIVTNRRVLCRDSHIIGHTERTVEYESITAVKPDQKGILAYIFGFGDISIETKSASAETIYFKKMAKHKHVAHLIATYMDKFGKSSDTITSAQAGVHAGTV